MSSESTWAQPIAPFRISTSTNSIRAIQKRPSSTTSPSPNASRPILSTNFRLFPPFFRVFPALLLSLGKTTTDPIFPSRIMSEPLQKTVDSASSALSPAIMAAPSPTPSYPPPNPGFVTLTSTDSPNSFHSATPQNPPPLGGLPSKSALSISVTTAPPGTILSPIIPSKRRRFPSPSPRPSTKRRAR